MMVAEDEVCEWKQNIHQRFWNVFSILLVSVWEKPSEMNISNCHRNVNIFCLSRIKLQKWMYPSVSVRNDEEWKKMKRMWVHAEREKERRSECVKEQFVRTLQWKLDIFVSHSIDYCVWNNSMFDEGDRSFEEVTVLHGDKHFQVSFAHRKSYRQFSFNCVLLSFTFFSVLSNFFCSACWFTVRHRC